MGSRRGRIFHSSMAGDGVNIATDVQLWANLDGAVLTYLGAPTFAGTKAVLVAKWTGMERNDNARLSEPRKSPTMSKEQDIHQHS